MAECGAERAPVVPRSRCRSLRRLAVACVVAALCAVGAVLAYPRLWVRVPGSVVTVGGLPSPGARVYRAMDGRLMLALPEFSSHRETYVLDPSTSGVWNMAGATHVFSTPAAVLCERAVPWGVDLVGETAKVSTPTDPRFSRLRVEFTPISGRRVHIQL